MGSRGCRQPGGERKVREATQEKKLACGRPNANSVAAKSNGEEQRQELYVVCALSEGSSIGVVVNLAESERLRLAGRGRVESEGKRSESRSYTSTA